MNEEINKIINWIEMSYTRLNYKEELLLINYIKQLQQENTRLKDKIEKATNFVDKYMDEWDFQDEVWQDMNDLLILLKEN